MIVNARADFINRKRVRRQKALSLFRCNSTLCFEVDRSSKSDLGHLVKGLPAVQSMSELSYSLLKSCARVVLPMSENTKAPAKGSDWTRLLTDPDLVSHLGKLLQTYRDVPAELRESALLQAMREIKDAAIKARELEKPTVAVADPPAPAPPAVLHHPEPIK